MSTPTGWICPKCGKVNAPWLPSCDCTLGYHDPTRINPTPDLPPLPHFGDPLPGEEPTTVCQGGRP